MPSPIPEYAQKTLELLDKHGLSGNLPKIFTEADEPTLQYLVSDQLTYLIKKQLRTGTIPEQLITETETILNTINQKPKLAKAYLETASYLPPSDAINILKQSGEIFQKADDPDNVIDTYLTLGHIQVENQDPDALHSFIVANIYTRNHKNPTTETKEKLVKGLIEVAKLRKNMGKSMNAYSSIMEAVRVAESIEDDDLIELAVLQQAVFLQNDGERERVIELISRYPKIKEKYL